MSFDANHLIQPAGERDVVALEKFLGKELGHFYRDRLQRAGSLLIAWVAEEPVGAVFLSLAPAEEEIVRRLLPGVPFLHRPHVHHDHRGQGIGTALVRAAEKAAERLGYRRVASGVDLTNERAVQLYQRLGYKEWEYGVVDTVREVYQSDGSVHTEPDRCRIFVKRLG